MPEAWARRNLADALYRVRQPLGAAADSIFITDEDTIALDRVWIDVNEFRALAGSSVLADRRAAIELYTSDLLEDIDAEWLMGPHDVRTSVKPRPKRFSRPESPNSRGETV